MRKIAVLFSVLILMVSCGPRDDEKLRDRGGRGGPQQGFNLNSGDVLTVTEEGQKLQSCREADQPTWNTVRLYSDVSFMFNQVNNLKVVVGRGDFNCVPVSTQKSIQIEVQEGDGFRKTGVFYYVTRLEMHNLADFIVKEDLVREMAEGMAMKPQQLITYLTNNNNRPQVTLTFLRPVGADGDAGEDNQDPIAASAIEELTLAAHEGATLSDCNSNWESMRMNADVEEALMPAVESQTLRAIIRSGDLNCMPVGSEMGLQVRRTNSWEDVPGVKLKATSVLRFDVNMIKSSDWFAEKLAEEMGLTGGRLQELVADWSQDQVTVTRVEWGNQ